MAGNLKTREEINAEIEKKQSDLDMLETGNVTNSPSSGPTVPEMIAALKVEIAQLEDLLKKARQP